ncbi:MAG: YbaB/EbfC family nucleoid-associated protein [Synergistaceae bacterium]|nr:YbaB/EbfC family nucleoid-associated protein [Synergistaceae bacterium]
MNMNKLMQQAQKMQAGLARAQEELAKIKVDGSSGGGAVKATVNGQGDLVAISISKDVVDPEDVEMLEDLILSAVKDALNKSKETAASKMSALTGGLGGFPGLM